MKSIISLVVTILFFSFSTAAIAEKPERVVNHHSTGAWAYVHAEWYEGRCVRVRAQFDPYTNRAKKGRPQIHGSVFITKEDVCDLNGKGWPKTLEHLSGYSFDELGNDIDLGPRSATSHVEFDHSFHYVPNDGGETVYSIDSHEISVDMILEAGKGASSRRTHHVYDYENECSVTRGRYNGREIEAEVEVFQIYVDGEPIIPEAHYSEASLGHASSGYVLRIYPSEDEEYCYIGKG